eukprot:Seg1996.4 transcript_id=Seg1996.4/GoldUCD/mRNA.D3Y31 product="Protein bud22" protein_id=Seg1996.4/GoldUCD/D3Y31
MDDDFFLPFEQKYTNDDHSTEGKDQKEDKDISKHENGPDFIALQPNNEYKVEVVARPKKKIKAGWPNLYKADSKVASNSDINENMEEQKGFLKHVIALSSDAIQWSDEESGQVDSHTDETTTIDLESPTTVAPKSDESGEKNSFPTKSEIENIDPVIDYIMSEGESSKVETQAISEAVSNHDTIIRKKQRAKKKKGKTTTTKSNTVPKIAETVKTFVKKARVFQVQRITRRISLLRKKKGDCQQLNKNERKIKRMLEHIEVLKNINLDVYSENIAKCLVDGIKSNRLLQEESSGYKWLEIALIEKQIDSAIVEKLLKMNTFLRYLGKILFANQDSSADKETDDEKIKQTSNQTDAIEAHIENDPKEEGDCTEKSNQETEVTKQKRMSTNYSTGLNATSVKSDEEKDVKFDRLAEHETATSIKESTQLPDEEFNEVTVAEDKIVLITGTQPESKKQKLATVRNRNSAKKANGIAVSKRADLKATKFDKEKLDAKNKTRFADALRKVQGTRGNRLGQRARRELWEKMFGSEAIHVKRGDKCERRGKRKRQADMGNKKARDTDKRKGFERSKKKAKTAKEEENLHPSWQAKKEQKHQAQIVEFKGNKITFDD